MILLALLSIVSGTFVSVEKLDIARKVAADGRPACQSHELDGTIGRCLPSFEIVPGASVNARATGSSIVFTRGAVSRLSTDEFALLAGHEIAHFYLGHAEGSSPTTELAADRLGAQLACQAGFDATAGVSLFRFFGAGKTHPRRPERRAAILEIECDRHVATQAKA